MTHSTMSPEFFLMIILPGGNSSFKAHLRHPHASLPVPSQCGQGHYVCTRYLDLCLHAECPQLIENACPTHSLRVFALVFHEPTLLTHNDFVDDCRWMGYISPTGSICLLLYRVSAVSDTINGGRFTTESDAAWMPKVSWTETWWATLYSNILLGPI